MRLAYIDARIAVRNEMSTSQIDAEMLVALAADHDVVALVDALGPGGDLAAAAGVDVRVSGKRALDHGALGRISAEHALVRQLAELHEQAPLAMVITGDAVTTDLAWYAPDLAAVPQVVALGGPLVGRLRLVSDDPWLVRRHGREAWCAASHILAADAVLGGAPPSAHGLAAVADTLPRIDGGGPVPEPASNVPGSSGLVVVVATTESRAGLGTLIAKVAERLELGAATTVVAIVPDVRLTGEATGALVTAGCPEHLRTATIVVSPGSDGAAAAFLAGADVVVAASPADLAVLAVRDVAATRPVLLLGGSPPQRAGPLAAPPLRRPPTGEWVLAQFDGDRTEVVAALRAAIGAEGVVLYTAAGVAEAAALAASPVPAGYDVVVMGRGDPATGQPSATELFPHVMAVHRSAIPSIERRLARAGDLWELIIATVGLDLADRVRLGIVPVPVGRGGVPVPRAYTPGLPGWLRGEGALPRLNLAEPDEAPPLAIPATAQTGGDSLRTWANQHRWSDRVRLALPWKWGLLARAMRGRW